ncbi:MAG: response regulator transcription factor [Deltaproteobacteria bacterium]|nr:response regulator transcription factor [Deltaproteobacteria bacterium]MCW5801752.1 response regulator transcription factor [Deltaproteobacteria bacterium]
MTRILVVEDDPSIRMGLEDTLAAKGYQVDVVGRGVDGAEHALSGRYDLVVLDVMLPDIDGFEVCRRIRASKGPTRRLPVIILSARGAELDRVRGLELGADDYVTKPFSLMELLARVASVLRRAQGDATEPTGLAFGDIDIDLVGQVATRGGARIELPNRAFAILKVFARRPGEVVSRDTLLDEAWGYEDYPNTRTVDNHLVKLRRALEAEPEKPRWLVTIHGAGYKLDVPREAVRWTAR